MKSTSNFLISLLAILIISSFTLPTASITPIETIDAIISPDDNQAMNKTIDSNFEDDYPDPGQFNLEEFIAYLVAILGGFLTTLLINFLKRKYPGWFPQSNTQLKDIVKEAIRLNAEEKVRELVKNSSKTIEHNFNHD